MTIACSQALAVRQAQPEDEPFLYQLYASTRTAELAALNGNTALQHRFLELQFRAQQQHYATYPHTTHLIIETTQQVYGRLETTPIGRLLTSRPPAEVRLVDISLLPLQRGKGIGTALLQWLQAEAGNQSKPLRLHVTPDNRARELYERLGFKLIEERGSHLFMEWRAAQTKES